MGADDSIKLTKRENRLLQHLRKSPDFTREVHAEKPGWIAKGNRGPGME